MADGAGQARRAGAGEQVVVVVGKKKGQWCGIGGAQRAAGTQDAGLGTRADTRHGRRRAAVVVSSGWAAGPPVSVTGG